MVRRCGEKHYRKTKERADFDHLPFENKDELDHDELSNDTSDVIPTTSKSIKKRSQSRIIRSFWFNREAQPQKHFRELLMLFTPWRKEETDELFILRRALCDST